MTDYARKEANRNMNTPLAELRARYLLEVKAAYIMHYEAGLMAPESYHILINSISDGLDKCDEELHDWKYLHGLVHYGFMFKLGIYWQRLGCIGPLVRRWVYRGVSTVYDVFQNYMVCSYHALELLE